MEYFALLQELNECHAPSGNEGELANRLAELARPYADECYTDTLGNLIVHKKGRGPKLLFAAHMDSIGLVVTHIEQDGYLRIGKIGGQALHSILHTPFRFQNGTMGVLVLSEKVKEKDLTMQDLYLDIGAKTKDEAETRVQIGDTAVSSMPTFCMGSRISAPYMDNHISCLVLLEAIKRLGTTENDLYFVFTVQEEVGLRGAKTAAFQIEPDYAVAVDITSAHEPDSKFQCSSILGGGAAIKVMDASVICHPQMVELLTQLATEQGIPHQKDVITLGGTDAGAIHVSRQGVLTGGICVPCRYIHSPVETVETSDVESCIRLVHALAKEPLQTVDKRS